MRRALSAMTSGSDVKIGVISGLGGVQQVKVRLVEKRNLSVRN